MDDNGGRFTYDLTESEVRTIGNSTIQTQVKYDMEGYIKIPSSASSFGGKFSLRIISDADNDALTTDCFDF